MKLCSTVRRREASTHSAIGLRSRRIKFKQKFKHIWDNFVYRTKDYNEQLSHLLKKPAYAKDFISALIAGPDGLSLIEALKKMISIMGMKEFSSLTGVSPPNLVARLQGRRNPKLETLNLYNWSL
jgi:DNA-binding phage protein